MLQGHAARGEPAVGVAADEPPAPARNAPPGGVEFGGGPGVRTVGADQAISPDPAGEGVMHLNLRFSPELPDGFVIYEAEIAVAGIRDRHRAALAFAAGRDHSLALEFQPANLNPIKVIGISRGWFFRRRRLLGYLPRATAVRIIERGFWDKVRPRLRNIWVSGESKQVIIRLDIVGPQEGKRDYFGA
jgi:hypothetical protein